MPRAARRFDVGPARSPGSVIVNGARSGTRPPGKIRGVGDAPATEDDYWAAGVDLLILRVADRLRFAGAALPDALLRDVAEQVVLDAARFALDWMEERPVSPRTGDLPRSVPRAGAPVPAADAVDAS
jgi:hypothetical protein